MNSETLSEYGPCLSDAEYEKSIKTLYETTAKELTSAAPRATDKSLKAKEFDLAIDYRLGVNFPSDKRIALWEAMQRAEGQRLRLIGKFIKTTIQKREFANGMQVMLQRMVEEFSKILTDEELHAFMDLKKGELPILPIEPDRL